MICFFENFNFSDYVLEVFFILIHNGESLLFSYLSDLKAVLETKELPAKKDISKETLSQAVIVERLTNYSLECSILEEHWDYGALFERQPVSQEISSSQDTVSFQKKPVLRGDIMTTVSLGEVFL